MLYDNCRTLSIHLFNEISLTLNYRLLVKEDDHLYTDEKLSEVWDAIIDEYHKLNDDNAQSNFYRKKGNIIHLEQRLMLLRSLEYLTYFPLTKQQRIEFDKLIIKHNIKDLKRELSATETKLGFLISEFEKEYSTNMEKFSFEHTLVRVSSLLGYQINRYKTSVAEWIELLKLAREKAKPLK